ncbi:MAG: molybdenum cofactor guanylyltransferase [Candidatus Marinimicrobia bacterium]|jgi:molybdopterin-guanine dinucleotide biosynthesis protein A|nr:molybdenum cofactor guanylyltransferase [Candidatus Neomarinimicrobiota bacterium]MDP6611165.1 molybdenum cofactor guanylyltransferase [Candidatus Neomarinimicrobiota bacterium]
MNKNTISATAFILIGGKSKRFGLPKWEAKIHNQTVLDKIWNACDNFENRFIVGKDKPQEMDKPFISDTLKIQAPINGLYTALEHSKTDWVLLLSCDLPLADTDLFQDLWNAHDDRVDVIVPFSNNKHQMTCAFYHKQVLPLISSAIQTSDYSLFKLLKKINPAVVRFDDDIRFWNMNTEQDLQSIITYCKLNF